MADRIKGITIEINGDSTGLQSALKEVNSSLRTAQNGLKDVNKLLKMDPGNVDLLRQKQTYLNDAISSTEEKLKTERQALEQMKNADGFDKNSEQAKALERQIIADEQALASLKEESKKFGSVASQQFKLVGDKVKEVGGKITDVGKGMTTHVSAPIAAVGAASIAAFKEVDAGMDIVIQKTGASGEALQGMQKTVENLATSIPTDFATAGNAVGEVNTRFGVTGEKLEELSGQFIKFAQLNETDVTSAVDQTQKALEAFGTSSKYTGRLLDILTYTGQQTGVSMETLLSGLTQNATAFQEMGLSMQGAVKFMGQMEMSGADTSTVMSGLQKALKNATEDGIPLNEALAQLQDTILNGTESTDGLTAAYDLFGKSGAQVFAAVQEGSLDFANLSNEMRDAGGALENTFNATLDPIDQVTTAMNQAKLAGADLGAAIQTAAAPVLQQLADVLKDITEKFRSLTPEQQQMIVKIGAIVAAVGPAIAVIGGLISGLGSIISVIGTVVGVLGGPLTLAIGAIIAIGVLLVKNWDKIKETAGKLKDWIGEKWTAIKEKTSEAWDGIKTTIGNAMETVKTQTQERLNLMKQAFEQNGGGIKGVAAATWAGIKDNYTKGFNALDKLTGGKLTQMKDLWFKCFEMVKDTVHNAIEKIKGFFNFDWKLPHLKLPHFSVSGSANPLDWFSQGVPHISVDWYRKAYDNPVLFTQPTVLQTPSGYKGFGDGAGGEVVLGMDKLRQLVGSGETNIQVNVYGAQGQDINQLADEVTRKIVAAQQQQTAVWA